MSRLLIKFPTRGRYSKFMDVLATYIDYLAEPQLTFFVVSVDDDDVTPAQEEEILSLLGRTALAGARIARGPPEGKIAAINRDIPAPASGSSSSWDILLLASDDMIPQVRGFDRLIRNKMEHTYPDFDGVLWWYDGYREDLNTLVCMGRTYYQRFGYIYYPEYRSLWCDNEFMDVAERLKRQTKIPLCIIRHEHPAAGFGVRDALYEANDRWNLQDFRLYLRRKRYPIDVTVAVCALEERTLQFQALHSKLVLMADRIRARLRVQLLVSSDAAGTRSIGEKRNDLAAAALGKYIAYVDDDDDVADDTFKLWADALDATPGADCVELRGLYYRDGRYQTSFHHSLRWTEWKADPSSNELVRPPNHLNPILTGLVRSVGFPPVSVGEDRVFSERIRGLLEREAACPSPVYVYRFLSKKRICTKAGPPEETET